MHRVQMKLATVKNGYKKSRFVKAANIGQLDKTGNHRNKLFHYFGTVKLFAILPRHSDHVHPFRQL